MNTSINTLIREAERLDNRSLDKFIANVISLRVRRTLPKNEEARLLAKINKSLPVNEAERFRTLNMKRVTQPLSELEQYELVALVEQIEKHNVQRIKYLTQLSRLRNVSVRELMAQLGIGTVNG